MPANLSPEYKTAEAAFRKAREPKERLECLKEMLRTMPKHKGTDHLQADIKTRIKELTEELAGPKKGGARGGPVTVIHPEGAGQIALVGPPSSGKSTLHHRLTGSHAAAGPYSFTTQFPQPGMLSFEDVHFQLVDLPPVCREHPVPWLANALQPADACLLVMDLGDPDCLDGLEEIRLVLGERRITLGGDRSPGGSDEGEATDDPFAVQLPALLLASKADRIPDIDAEIRVFRELSGTYLPVLPVSAQSGLGLDAIGRWLFDTLRIVRVYTKPPGGEPDRNRPFTLRAGQTVEDLASLVHRDMAASLKYARLWGGGQFSGQQVGRDHVLSDGDVVEIHI